jgi:FMN-binding protein
MKRAPLLVFAGTAAGFIGVLSFHSRPAPLTLTSGGTGSSAAETPAATPGNHGVVGPGVGPGAVRSAVGASEQFGYGILDVKVTVSGNRITDVSVPTLEVAEYTSQQICAQAIPILRSEVLTAQSARIDAISGATYTSEAYAASLQAALDALHAK